MTRRALAALAPAAGRAFAQGASNKAIVLGQSIGCRFVDRTLISKDQRFVR